ncbi:hypothetical protein JCM10908_006649 [Rhodotorula pacifica]|uniref:uncharacterized protein n=1 Tax=Rhodotorula pacifica TaxID=1495444 RepID=UPI00316E5D3D
MQSSNSDDDWEREVLALPLRTKKGGPSGEKCSRTSCTGSVDAATGGPWTHEPRVEDEYPHRAQEFHQLFLDDEGEEQWGEERDRPARKRSRWDKAVGTTSASSSPTPSSSASTASPATSVPEQQSTRLHSNAGASQAPPRMQENQDQQRTRAGRVIWTAAEDARLRSAILTHYRLDPSSANLRDVYVTSPAAKDNPWPGIKRIFDSLADAGCHETSPDRSSIALYGRYSRALSGEAAAVAFEANGTRAVTSYGLAAEQRDLALSTESIQAQMTVTSPVWQACGHIASVDGANDTSGLTDSVAAASTSRDSGRNASSTGDPSQVFTSGCLVLKLTFFLIPLEANGAQATQSPATAPATQRAIEAHGRTDLVGSPASESAYFPDLFAGSCTAPASQTSPASHAGAPAASAETARQPTRESIARVRFSAEEDAQIIEQVGRQSSLAAIARALGRQHASVYTRVNTLRAAGKIPPVVAGEQPFSALPVTNDAAAPSSSVAPILTLTANPQVQLTGTSSSYIPNSQPASHSNARPAETTNAISIASTPGNSISAPAAPAPPAATPANAPFIPKQRFLPEEDKLLFELYDSGASWALISERLKRTKGSCVSRHALVREKAKLTGEPLPNQAVASCSDAAVQAASPSSGLGAVVAPDSRSEASPGPATFNVPASNLRPIPAPPLPASSATTAHPVPLPPEQANPSASSSSSTSAPARSAVQTQPSCETLPPGGWQHYKTGMDGLERFLKLSGRSGGGGGGENGSEGKQ